MDEQTAAVNVAQEIVAQARAAARALYDAGDVRQHEGHALVHVDDAEVREERGEVVVRDLGVRVRDDGEQRALADVREADEAHVRKELELQRYRVRLAGQAGLGEAGYLASGRGKVLVAPAAAPAAAGDVVLARGHVVHDGAAVRVPQDGPARDLEDDARAVFPGAALALTGLAVFRRELTLVAEVHERGHVLVHGEDDTAAAAAVAAVRPARRDVFLAVEGDGPGPAVAGADLDRHLVNKW